MNWVIPLFKDILKSRETISTTLLPFKTFPFKKAYHIIDINDRNSCQLRRFLEIAYKRYIELESSFGIKFVIEYYISAVREEISENKFIIGYIALECLAGYVPAYAKESGNKLENNASVANTVKKIEKILRKYQLLVSGDIIHELGDEIAYKPIGIKVTIPYLASKFGVKIDKKILNDLVDFRGTLLHTGRDKGNLASEQNKNLFDIIERALLTMLGWKGHPYINKVSGYRLMTLD